MRQEVRRIDAAGLDGAQAVDDELRLALVTFDAAANVHQPAERHGIVKLLRSVPHAGEHLAAAIGEHGVNVEAAAVGRAEILLNDQKNLVVEPLTGLEVRDSGPGGGRDG